MTFTTLGAEAVAATVVRGDWLAVEANATWQDPRNTSVGGTSGAFVDDASPSARGSSPTPRCASGSRASRGGGTSSPSVHARYVHGFYRGGESGGA